MHSYRGSALPVRDSDLKVDATSSAADEFDSDSDVLELAGSARATAPKSKPMWLKVGVVAAVVLAGGVSVTLLRQFGVSGVAVAVENDSSAPTEETEPVVSELPIETEDPTATAMASSATATGAVGAKSAVAADPETGHDIQGVSVGVEQDEAPASRWTWKRLLSGALSSGHRPCGSRVLLRANNGCS